MPKHSRIRAVERTNLNPIKTYLFDWKRGGMGYRYCHLLTEAEVQNLAAQSDFQVVEQFFADADLNLFSVLRRTE